MPFIILLGLTAFILAAAAAYFSIFGLIHIFVGAMIPIIAMGIGLEAGKLMCASYLYRSWDKMTLVFKSFLLGLVVFLMVLTSLGIFGYLSASYQSDSAPMKEVAAQLDIKKADLEINLNRKLDMDKQIANLPNNYVNGRDRLMKIFKPELDKVNSEISRLRKEIAEGEAQKISTGTHIGPLIYIAERTGKTPDEIMFYFILFIVMLFDPAAVGLTIATNKEIMDRKKRLAGISDEPKPEKFKSQEIVASTPPEPTPEPTREQMLTEFEKIDNAARRRNLLAKTRRND